MPANQKIIIAINEQIGNELGAMPQYSAVTVHFGAEALPELSAHFHEQAEEEKKHALRFIRFVIDTGARVNIPAVSAPWKCGIKKSVTEIRHPGFTYSAFNGRAAMIRIENPARTFDYSGTRKRVVGVFNSAESNPARSPGTPATRLINEQEPAGLYPASR